MRILDAVVLGFLAIGPIAAQGFSGVGRVSAPGNPWGNVVHPAIPGNGYGARSFYGGRGSGYRGSGYGVYAFPMYVGGYGYGGYGLGYDSGNDQGPAPAAQQQPNTVVVYPPAQPPVVINQYLGAPPADQATESNMRVYQTPNAPNASDMSASEGPYYLIAYKDHTIYSAVAYYVEGDTLHYFTSGNVHNQVSLSLVDRQLTAQLNRERNVDVQLGK